MGQFGQSGRRLDHSHQALRQVHRFGLHVGHGHLATETTGQVVGEDGPEEGHVDQPAGEFLDDDGDFDTGRLVGAQ